MEKQKFQGVDPRQVFAQLLREDFDPKKIESMDLTFAERKFPYDGINQVVSIIDTGSGRIDCFPAVMRYQPKLGVPLKCYVRFHQKKDGTVMAFAMPVNLREARRTGQFKELGNNIIDIAFRKNRETGDVYALGPNRKTVIPAPGFEPEVGRRMKVMVSEDINKLLAYLEVPEEQASDKTSEGQTGLMLMADNIGATLEGVDKYDLKFGGQHYDTCSILKVPETATLEELKGVYKALVKENEPDTKCQEYCELTGDEPSEAQKQEFNYEASLIHVAYKKMKLVREREAAEQAYLQVGRREHKWLGNTIVVSVLATKLGVDNATMKHVLKKVGYDVKLADSIKDKIAWTAAGYLKKQQEAGTLDVVGREIETDKVEIERQLQEALNNRTLGTGQPK